MKTLLSAVAAAAVTLLVGSAAYAIPNCTSSFCNSGGSQCSLSGQVHTCGTCNGGTTHVLYVGSLTSSDADAACACQHEPTANCSDAGRQVINNQPKDPADTKTVKKAARVRAIAP